jgi:osmotically-inducible protein OsmY
MLPTGRYLEGVTGASNLIAVKPRVKPTDVEKRVQETIERAPSLDARLIWVTTSNGTVHLRGKGHSLYEKKLAENVTKAAPGIKEVDNEIVVVP